VRAVLVTDDLMFSSRAAALARAAGTTLVMAGSVAKAVEACAAEPAALVMLDLSLRGLDPATAVEALRGVSQPPRIVAYAPHVHEAKLAAATGAGCDQVLTRGQFNAQLDALLRGEE
jgi:CheY-like chemotaxis protein